MSDSSPTARFYGYVDARCYEAYDPALYDEEDEEDAEAYREGYGKGMDLNLESENGEAPEEDRG